MRSKSDSAAEKVTREALRVATRLVETATLTATKLAQETVAADARITAHEAICAERYGSIKDAIKKLESIVLWGGALAVSSVGVLIIALAAVAWAFLKKELKLP